MSDFIRPGKSSVFSRYPVRITAMTWEYLKSLDAKKKKPRKTSRKKP